jgi:hypothetical protein
MTLFVLPAFLLISYFSPPVQQDEKLEEVLNEEYTFTFAQKPERHVYVPEEDVKPLKPTLNELIEAYESTFATFYKQVNGKVEELMQVAYNEYMTKKNNNEKVSYPYFYAKYFTAAKSLEKDTDIAFHVIYETFLNDLNKYGYDPQLAHDYLKSYENIKQSVQTSIMKEVTKKF